MLANRMIMSAGEAGPVAISYVGSNGDTVDRSTYTFSAEAIGTATADRVVIVGVYGVDNAASATLDSVTVGGNTMADLGTATVSTTSITSLRAYALAAGTTADIVCTFNQTMQACGIAVWTVTGNGASAAAHASDSDEDDSTTINLSFNVPANGGAIAIVGARDSDQSWGAWTGLDEDEEFTVELPSTAVASKIFDTAQTPLAVAVTYSGNGKESGCGASFAPG